MTTCELCNMGAFLFALATCITTAALLARVRSVPGVLRRASCRGASWLDQLWRLLQLQPLWHDTTIELPA